MCCRYHCGFSNISLCIWLHWVLLASHRIFHLRCSLWGLQFSSVQLLSRADSLRPHEPQHARPPCPSPTLRAYSNSCPPSWSCHPTISSYVIPFSSCLQSFPGSGSFPINQFFASGGQSIGVSALVSVLPMNIQDFL